MNHRSVLFLASCLLLVSCQNSSNPPGCLPAAGTFQRSGVIGLEVATANTTYRPGEEFHFTVRPSEDCYLAAWVLGADGVTTSIYPNAHDAGRVFRKGVTASLPGRGSFVFRVTPPAGREQLVVVASSLPVTASQPPPAGQWLKGMGVEPRLVSSPPPQLVERRGEARVVYEVLP